MGVHSHLLAKIPPFRSRIQRLCSLFDEIADFLGGVIDDHLRDHDYAEVHEPTDFIDAYLLEMEKRKHSEQQTFFTRRQLQNVAFDAYVAGQETTAATVTWILAYLIRYPEVQRASARGNGPSGRERAVYPNPHVFQPDRFIDENGQLKRSDQLLPFSLGRRACPGESLAKQEIFLFISNLLNHYEAAREKDFSAGQNPPTLLKAAGGGSISTQPFTCKLKRRFGHEH
ncbi:(pine wood nematode) hypothetical protein [Aphelenchoides fujianensis]|nr:(pine wood nematode) hypothetical protein [Aphelenchoides fujianensis]